MTTQIVPGNRLSARRTILRGRQHELGRLVELLTAGSSGALGVVEGPAGSGKTRILEEVARVAGRISIRTLNSTLAPVTEKRVRALAATGPTVVLVDDLQWSDVNTYDAFARLPEQLADQPITWLTALRDQPRPNPWETTFRRSLESRATVRIELPPLTADAVRAIVRDQFQEVPAWALELAEVAQGQPRLLHELLSDIVNGDEAPGAAVIRRLRRMSVPARAVTQAASMLRVSFSLEELGDVAGVGQEQLGELVAESVNSGLLLLDAGAARFRHVEIREAVQASVPSAARHSVRRHAVDVALQHGATAVEVAPMLASVAVAGDTAAVRLLRKATRELAGFEADRAAALGLRAFELDPEGASDRGFAMDVLRLLWLTGRVREARELAERITASSRDPATQALIRLVISRCAIHDLSADLGRGHMGGIDQALQKIPPGIRAQVLAEEALGLSFTGPGADADRAIAEAKVAAAASHDDTAVARVLLAESVRVYYRDLTRAEEALAAAERILARSEHPAELQQFSLLWRSMLLMVGDRLADAMVAFDDNEAGLRSRGNVRESRALRACRATLLLEVGRVEDARREAQEVIEADETASAASDPVVARMWFVLLRTGLHMADEVITARCLAEAERMLCGASARARRIGAWSTAIAAASEGRHETALRSANPAYAALDAGDPPMLLVQSPLESVELARIALLGGNRTQAEIVLRDLRARHLASPSVAVLEAGCRHIEGLLNGDPLALRSATALYASGSRILAQALAEEDAGALADTSGDAVAKFDAALEIYERAGATADAARVRARLRSHGVIRRARVSQDGAAGGLTRTEHAVVDLIVAGCSDREIAEKLFISAHTVRSHITHIFEKLDVGSRVEIVSRMERG